MRRPRRGCLTAAVGLAAALLLSAGRAAHAQTTPVSGVGNAGVASDYVFRGVDESAGGVAGLGGLDLSLGRLYVGAWASNVDLKRFGDALASAEIDVYGGWRSSLIGYDLDLGAIAYTYVTPAEREDYVEAYGKVSRAIGPFSATLAVYASPRYPRAAGAGAYADAKASYAVTRQLSLSATVGGQYQAHAVAPVPCLPTEAGCAGPYSDLIDVDWSLGASYALTDNIDLNLQYTDTNAHDLGAAFHTHLVFSARANFP